MGDRWGCFNQVSGTQHLSSNIENKWTKKKVTLILPTFSWIFISKAIQTRCPGTKLSPALSLTLSSSWGRTHRAQVVCWVFGLLWTSPGQGWWQGSAAASLGRPEIGCNWRLGWWRPVWWVRSGFVLVFGRQIEGGRRPKKNASFRHFSQSCRLSGSQFFCFKFCLTNFSVFRIVLRFLIVVLSWARPCLKKKQ